MRNVVVDANMLQHPDLMVQLKADSETTFVIPDVALLEMCKHENCCLTMRLAFQVFVEHIERVVVARSVGEILNIELGSLSPITVDGLLSQHFTAFMRQLIVDLNRNCEQDKEAIEKKFGDARESLLRLDLNAAAAKARTESLLNILKQGLTRQIVMAIRKPVLERDRLLSFVQVMAEVFLRQLLRKDYRMSEEEALFLIEQRPMYLRYYYVLAWHCLMTIRTGGDISAMKAEKELNHHLDLDYVMVASYFDDLLSCDNRVKDAYRDLRAIIATSSDVAHKRVEEWFLEIGVGR